MKARARSLRAPARRSTAVDRVHRGEARWQREFAALRDICLGAGLNEALKWGQACYDLDGRNVVLIHGFKDYCALLFMKGVLLRDRDHILVQQTKNVHAARQIRFSSLADIEARRPALAAEIDEALALERSGATVEKRAVESYEVPAELAARLEREPRLAKAFAALTPGRRKAYLLHFSGAKKAETRSARIDRHAPRILQGLGLDD